MALTGLQIQKLLPKTNCKECGSNTCLAFAMKLASKKAQLSDCPYVSEEATTVLAADSEPPIRTVSVGKERVLKTGGETVMYRHEKTFLNPTGLGVELADTLSRDELHRQAADLAKYMVVRVGEELRADLVCVTCKSGEVQRLLDAFDVVSSVWSGPIAIRSSNTQILSRVAEKHPGKKLLLASATPEDAEELAKVAAQAECALAIASNELDVLVSTAAKIRATGFRDIFLEFLGDSLCEQYQTNAIIRKAALKGAVKDLGFPTLRFIDTGNSMDDAVQAGIEISKYGGLVILPQFDPSVFVSLLALRQNIFTDPQKPIQVDPKVYAIGEPDANSPVFVTTNFSLTYFIISGEIENAGVSAWLAVPECEGMSVLTAWAAGKFSGEKVASFVKESELTKLERKRIVIPGYVAQISGELEEALPGWQILVGPQEAGDIESFVKNVLGAA